MIKKLNRLTNLESQYSSNWIGLCWLTIKLSFLNSKFKVLGIDSN